MVVNIFNISALYRYFIGAIRGSQMVFKDFLKNCLAVFEILWDFIIYCDFIILVLIGTWLTIYH